MSKKPTKKIIINGIEYVQVRKDDVDGNAIWWKNVPQVPNGVSGSGLHMFEDGKNHYDFYIDGQKIDSEPTTEKVGSTIIIDTKGNGTFCAPKGKILVLTGKGGNPTFISPEEYLTNKEQYMVVLRNNHGQPHVLALSFMKKKK